MKYINWSAAFQTTLILLGCGAALGIFYPVMLFLDVWAASAAAFWYIGVLEGRSQSLGEAPESANSQTYVLRMAAIILGCGAALVSPFPIAVFLGVLAVSSAAFWYLGVFKGRYWSTGVDPNSEESEPAQYQMVAILLGCGAALISRSPILVFLGVWVASAATFWCLGNPKIQALLNSVQGGDGGSGGGDGGGGGGC